MTAEQRDIIVIGAGAAGLAAAAALGRAGQPVLVLEARDRIGGRVWSRYEPALPVPVELGAEFIHGASRETHEWLRSIGQAATDTSGEHWSFVDGRLQRRTQSLLGQVRAALEAGDVLSRPDTALESFLTSESGRTLSEEARSMARAFVSGFDAADPERVSLHSVAEEWGAGGMLDSSQSRPAGGYGTLLLALRAALDPAHVHLQLQTVVTDIHWSNRSVEVTGRRLGEAFRATARKVIVTVPLGVLKLSPQSEGAIRFAPTLETKQPAFDRLLAGPVLKVMLHFRRPFWEALHDGRYADASFFHAPGKVFPTFWTTLPARTSLLNAWVGGPAAARLGDLPDGEVIRHALECVAAVFSRDKENLELEAAYVHNWHRDPFAQGAYSYVAVGGARAREILATPLEGALFFAGEATDTSGDATTVTGALRSGVRAALEVRQYLEGQR
ncbi:MAG: flavin monoamine oxidase family protein [Steroidobacteraceae bacterium]